MKQNPCPVVGEVAKPTGVGLDELDGAIEAFSTGIADFVLTKVEPTRLMAPEHLDHLFDGLQSTPRGIGIHGITKVFGDVKLVMHDVGLGQTLLGRAHKGRPYIHGHRFDRCALRRRERFKKTLGSLQFSLWHQIKYPRAANVKYSDINNAA